MVELVFERGRTRGWGTAKAILSSGTVLRVHIGKAIDGRYMAVLLYHNRHKARHYGRMVGHRLLLAKKRKDLIPMIEKFLV